MQILLHEVNDRLRVKKYGGFKRKVLTVILLLLIFRPIIDLSGAYHGDAINLGGVYGFFFACICAMFFFMCWFEKERLHLFLVFLVLIFLSYCIGFLANGISIESIVSLGRFVIGFSAFVFLIVPKEYRINFNKLTRLFFFIILIPITIAWLQYVGLYPYSYYDYVNGVPIGRPSGGYFQPNSLTRLLIFACILLYIIDKYMPIKQTTKYGFLLLFLATTFISSHRTSLIILIVTLCYFEMYVYFNKFIKKIPLLVLFFTAFGVFILIKMKEKLLLHWEIYKSAIFIFNESGELSFRGRGVVWKDVVQLLSENEYFQWMFGLGYPPFEAHNDFLRILLVNGILGLIFYLLFFVYVYRFVKKRVNQFGLKVLRISYLFLFLYSIPLQPTEYPSFMWMFFFVLMTTIFLFPNIQSCVPKEG